MHVFPIRGGNFGDSRKIYPERNAEVSRFQSFKVQVAAYDAARSATH